MTPEQAFKFDFFSSLFNQDGFELSVKARTDLELHGEREYTYGEVSYLYFVPVLEFVKP